MQAAFKCSQLKNTLTVVYNEDALLERRKTLGGRSHSRGTGTVRQTEGILIITSPGCPKLQKRPNLNHEGSTAGDALTQVSVPTEELHNCIYYIKLTLQGQNLRKKVFGCTWFSYHSKHTNLYYASICSQVAVLDNVSREEKTLSQGHVFLASRTSSPEGGGRQLKSCCH